MDEDNEIGEEDKQLEEPDQGSESSMRLRMISDLDIRSTVSKEVKVLPSVIDMGPGEDATENPETIKIQHNEGLPETPKIEATELSDLKIGKKGNSSSFLPSPEKLG